MEGKRPGESNAAPDPAKGKRARWVIVAVVVVIVLLAAQGIWSRHDAHAALERDAEHASQTSVEVVRPQKSNAGLDLVLPGNVQAFLDTPIYARTNGYLKKWYADIGAHVKNGQLFAEIDTPEVDDQLRAREKHRRPLDRHVEKQIGFEAGNRREGRRHAREERHARRRALQRGAP